MRRVIGLLGQKGVKSIWRRQDGTAVVPVALALVVLLAMVGTVTDVGLVFLHKYRLSNALDAAALAGAQELPENPEKAREKAREYAEKNGVDPATITVEISDDNREIRVAGEKEVQLLFAKVLGYTKSRVNSTSAARVGGITRVVGAAPLGIEEQPFQYGEEYVLKVGGGCGSYGWFGALSLGGTGANVYRMNLMYGYNRELKVGDIVPTETGNMSGPTRDGIEYRIQSCKHIPKCTYDHYVRDCPQVLLVPIIRPIASNGNQVKEVQVVGFGAFFVEGVAGTGKESIVTGRFIHYLYPGDVDFNQVYYGLKGVKLVR